LIVVRFLIGGNRNLLCSAEMPSRVTSPPSMAESSGFKTPSVHSKTISV
jgi:hypothetical protein